MIIIADAGPLLHLFWVGASSWALPPHPIEVVDEVWEEVQIHAPLALMDSRLQRVTVSEPAPEMIARWNLDRGEQAALQLALSRQSNQDVLVLCDERQARMACKALLLPVVGSIGLVVEAFKAGRVTEDSATQALRDLPGVGRLHIASHLIETAIAALKQQ